ncbi:hypothetical protein D9619_013386 [Psilocybe cf. subviscida]|uniref:Uncharacterized protein n=1 Tax=Psilocybe cf. subviscida TaxID=2480587 RepID=A0A8H5F900_9AGAR|nr:hypothetical protein D9619_013386 [Psilocybe cf. subviscida]
MALRFLSAYNNLLHRRPMLTQCATGAVIFAAGDLVAQQVVEKRGLKGHDLTRTARVVAYRGLIFGPLLTKWFQYLNSVNASSSIRTLAYRVGLDQFVAGPMFIGLFYTTMSVMEGVPHEALPRLERAFMPSLMVGWGVYMPVQILNFTLVPPHMRVLFVSGISLFWNAYLSAANNQHSKSALPVSGTTDSETIVTALPIPMPVVLQEADAATAASVAVSTATAITSKVKHHTVPRKITTTGPAIA